MSTSWNRPGELFQGLYLDLKLPFRKAEAGEQPFRHLKPPFTPYQHQLEAFRRLGGNAPQSTIVATGTGSGKTECFMLPVLDDCLHRREQGIKTIVIYPMNATLRRISRSSAEASNAGCALRDGARGMLRRGNPSLPGADVLTERFARLAPERIRRAVAVSDDVPVTLV